jgi:hypothetical protein
VCNASASTTPQQRRSVQMLELIVRTASDDSDESDESNDSDDGGRAADI